MLLLWDGILQIWGHHWHHGEGKPNLHLYSLIDYFKTLGLVCTTTKKKSEVFAKILKNL